MSSPSSRRRSTPSATTEERDPNVEAEDEDMATGTTEDNGEDSAGDFAGASSPNRKKPPAFPEVAGASPNDSKMKLRSSSAKKRPRSSKEDATAATAPSPSSSSLSRRQQQQQDGGTAAKRLRKKARLLQPDTVKKNEDSGDGAMEEDGEGLEEQDGDEAMQEAVEAEDAMAAPSAAAAAGENDNDDDEKVEIVSVKPAASPSQRSSNGDSASHPVAASAVTVAAAKPSPQQAVPLSVSSVAAPAAAAAAAPAPAAPLPDYRLRMPSEQTPGRPEETAVLSTAPPPPTRRLILDYDGPKKITKKVRDTLARLRAENGQASPVTASQPQTPQPEAAAAAAAPEEYQEPQQPAVQEEKHDGEEEQGHTSAPPSLGKLTVLWFLGLWVVQVLAGSVWEGLGPAAMRAAAAETSRSFADWWEEQFSEAEPEVPESWLPVNDTMLGRIVSQSVRRKHMAAKSQRLDLIRRHREENLATVRQMKEVQVFQDHMDLFLGEIEVRSAAEYASNEVERARSELLQEVDEKREELFTYLKTSSLVLRSMETQAQRLMEELSAKRSTEQRSKLYWQNLLETLSAATTPPPVSTYEEEGAHSRLSPASPAMLTRIRKQLEVRGDDVMLLDNIGAVPLWQVQPACLETDDDDEEEEEDYADYEAIQNVLANLAEADTVQDSFLQLQKQATRDLAYLKDDPNVAIGITKWAREAGLERLAAVPPFRKKKKRKKRSRSLASTRVRRAGGSDTSGSALLAIRDAIRDHLEVVLSGDGTGQVDYAALMNGARIIRYGDRATTPGLVDELPLVNRLASALKLRFYGHGAEAALTPVVPPAGGLPGDLSSALGQCWAFTKSADSKYSAYATLTIRLSRPVHVTSVAVEHPVSAKDRQSSAIRAFRVTGFESPHATGRGWTLGDFEYRIADKSGGEMPSRQEFFIRDDAGTFPPVAAVSVAIDSNWGKEYGCLYRFRVHGTTADEIEGEK